MVSHKSSSTSRIFHYSCRISKEVTYDLARFEHWVHKILRDKRGWRRWGFEFVPHSIKESEIDLRRKHKGQFFIIELEADQIIARYGTDFKGMSVANCSDNHISINFTRWITGPKPSKHDPVRHMRRKDYRTYVILHEVGHILSKCHSEDHKTCVQGPAPIMLQQTNGVGTCQPNSWPIEGIDNVLAEQARPVSK